MLDIDKSTVDFLVTENMVQEVEKVLSHDVPLVHAIVEDDAPRDKCAHFREINGIAAAFQHLQKNYNPIASSFL